MARHRRLLPSGSLLVLTWLLLVHGCGSDGDGAGGNGRPPAADQGAGADGQDAASDAAGGAADAGTGATDGSGGEDITAAADGAATDLGPQLSPLAIPEGCNPLAADWDCLLPFPSDVFLAADPALPGGRRLVLPERARPRPAGIEEPLDFTVLHPADGFSHLPPILALFPDGVAPGPLTFHDEDTSQTLLPESPTLLLEAAGGQPVRHFAELDPRTLDRSRQALLLRPLARLKDSTRYVVALRGLRSPRGQLLPVPEGFRRIRDGQTGGDPVLAPLAARYEREVFPVLEAAGVRRASLQLAWDFTTESAELTEGDLRAVRADLIDRLEAEPPPVTVERVQDEVDAFIFRRIQARMSVPLYLEQSAPEALLHRDDQGRVTANGTVEVPITVQIPRSVATGQAAILPVRVLQFGHGFFSNRGEADGTFPRDFAERNGLVLVSADWWGMTDEDKVPLLASLTERPSQAFRFIDRVHQGMANFIAVGYALRGALAEHEAMRLGGRLVYDPRSLYFYGISQGHILGGTFMALTPHIERGVLGAGGCTFSFMMFRSWHFNAFLLIISQLLPDPLDQQKFVALCQTTLDRIDPITYAPYVLSSTMPGSPASRRLLMQVGIGDPAVPNLAAHIHARSLGLSLLEPAARPLQAIPTAPAPFDGSALVEVDYGLPSPLPGDMAVPPVTDNVVHEAVRRNLPSQQQIDAFLRPDGRIESFCDGPCDPG